MNYISTTMAASILGVTQGYIRKLIKKGSIEALKISNRDWLVIEDSVLKLKKTKNNKT